MVDFHLEIKFTREDDALHVKPRQNSHRFHSHLIYKYIHNTSYMYFFLNSRLTKAE